MRRWLGAHRSADDVARLLSALRRTRATLKRFPGLGEPVAGRPGTSVRVLGLGRLPYLVWYWFDPDEPGDPVWLLALTHEKQDRARFDPTSYES